MTTETIRIPTDTERQILREMSDRIAVRQADGAAPAELMDLGTQKLEAGRRFYGVESGR